MASIQTNDRTAAHGELVHQWFENHAAATPSAVALICDGQQITYGELNARANRLAHTLIDRGVGRESLVGLCMDRSVDLVVGILATIKSGGAYLPLDPAYPASRLSFMLKDSGAKVLLASRGASQDLDAGQATVLRLDEAVLATDDRNPEVEVASEDTAYVIYTSGSTGQPKGVIVTHSNLSRLFSSTDGWFHFGPSDVWTLFHSFAFDFSVWEFWGALAYGGTLVVVPYEVSRSPHEFYRLLCDRGVTVLNQTPSAFRQLIRAEEMLGADVNLSLRLVIFGGEALEVQGLRSWFDRHGDQAPQLVNMYGITETTVHVTYRPLSKTDLNQKRSGSPIGVPIPDLTVCILDESLLSVPDGMPGEMYVGGAGVARGYLDRPQLTASRFLPDPSTTDASARLYRTGDLAVRQSDGQLEFLGRADEQVKIRGFRIELGEIESALARHSAVAESVVIVREDDPGDRRLIAYVTSRPGATIEVPTLRAVLQRTLPEYMVPTAIVVLDALPLTTNGKVNRTALPSPQICHGQGGTEPVTDWEKRLHVIWSKLLNCNPGLDEKFFDLGGSSLQLMEVHTELTQILGKSVPVTNLFEHTTIRTLAGWLADGGLEKTSSSGIRDRGDRQRDAFARQRKLNRGAV